MTRFYAEDVTGPSDLSVGDEVISRITNRHKQRDGAVWFECEPIISRDTRFDPVEVDLSPSEFTVGDYLLFEYTGGSDVQYAGQAQNPA